MDCIYFFPTHLSSECRDLISRMLIRDPRQRASLQDILNDSWLREVRESSEQLPPEPLVSRQIISPDDHEVIISRMIEGNLSSREDIQRALERNEYDYVTATYYLLAERKLKRQMAAALSSLGGVGMDDSYRVRHSDGPPPTASAASPGPSEGASGGSAAAGGPIVRILGEPRGCCRAKIMQGSCVPFFSTTRA